MATRGRQKGSKKFVCSCGTTFMAVPPANGVRYVKCTLCGKAMSRENMKIGK